jgi:hypothetical protein
VILLIGEPADLEKVRTHFLAVCTEVAATVKDEPNLNVPHTEGEWYGVHFDYVRKVVRLTSKAHAKFARAREVASGQ